jgi:hypothetical protein
LIRAAGEIGQWKEKKILTLQEMLRKHKEEVLSHLAAEDVAIMEQATEALVRSGIAARAKKIGDRAPDFTLPNPNGELINLADLLTRGPVVVTFYRGVW